MGRYGLKSYMGLIMKSVLEYLVLYVLGRGPTAIYRSLMMFWKGVHEMKSPLCKYEVAITIDHFRGKFSLT